MDGWPVGRCVWGGQYVGGVVVVVVVVVGGQTESK